MNVPSPLRGKVSSPDSLGRLTTGPEMAVENSLAGPFKCQNPNRKKTRYGSRPHLVEVPHHGPRWSCLHGGRSRTPFYNGVTGKYLLSDRGASGFPTPPSAPEGTVSNQVPRPAMAPQGKCHEWFNSKRLMMATSSRDSDAPRGLSSRLI